MTPTEEKIRAEAVRQDWQPVRIKPLGDESSYVDNDGLPWPVGKIIRVRAAVPPIRCGQGHLGYQVHPEDDWGHDGMLICDDQFLAD